MSLKRPRIDLNSACRHLRALDRAGAPHIFLCVPEAPGVEGPVRHVLSPFEIARTALEMAQQAGYGVFVTVNQMRNGRRLKSQVTRIRALWIERDGPGADLPLTPSLAIETSPGKRHEYLLTESEDVPDVAEATRMNRTIARRYGGDRQATDVARALRLAGSWHLKGEPHVVHILDCPGLRYASAALTIAFSEPQNEQFAPRHPPLPTCSGGYRAAAVKGICAELGHAVVGTRNNTLNRAAYRMGRLGLELGDIDALLTPIALSIGLTEAETMATIRSGAKAGGGARGQWIG